MHLCKTQGLPVKSYTVITSLITLSVKNLPTIQETLVRFLGQEDPLEKEMATHSSILAWEIPLQSMGSQSVGHNWVTDHITHRINWGLHCWLSSEESACQCWRLGFDPWVQKILRRRKRQPTPAFLPGKSHGQRSLLGYSPWGHKNNSSNRVN